MLNVIKNVLINSMDQLYSLIITAILAVIKPGGVIDGPIVITSVIIKKFAIIISIFSGITINFVKTHLSNFVKPSSLIKIITTFIGVIVNITAYNLNIITYIK